MGASLGCCEGLNWVRRCAVRGRPLCAVGIHPWRSGGGVCVRRSLPDSYYHLMNAFGFTTSGDRGGGRVEPREESDVRGESVEVPRKRWRVGLRRPQLRHRRRALRLAQPAQLRRRKPMQG